MTSLDEEITALCKKYIDSDDVRFGKIVCFLLEVCGAPKVHTGRIGDINDRIDAKIDFSDGTVPIELKSPTETLEIPLKAIRQAAENKVMLQHLDIPNDPAKSTLAIGWELPPDRSQLSELIQRIHDHYAIKVCVIDFRTLITMAYRRDVEDIEVDWESLLSHIGIWRVEE